MSKPIVTQSAASESVGTGAVFSGTGTAVRVLSNDPGNQISIARPSEHYTSPQGITLTQATYEYWWIPPGYELKNLGATNIEVCAVGFSM